MAYKQVFTGTGVRLCIHCMKPVELCMAPASVSSSPASVITFCMSGQPLLFALGEGKESLDKKLMFLCMVAPVCDTRPSGFCP